MNIIITEPEITKNLRVLKIKMDRTNIKYLFDNDSNIYSYLFNKTSTFSTCYGESVSLQILNILNNKEIKSNMVFEEIKKMYNIDESYYDMLLDILINDYNKYYLDDNFYYNGEWYDGSWYNFN